MRGILNDDLPLIDDAVTIEHLLGHTSGIGDYLDEEGDWEVDDYILTVPVHELATTEAFVRAIDGFPQKFPPGERFSYCNGGYMVLAIVAERVSGMPFHDLIGTRVLVARRPVADGLPAARRTARRCGDRLPATRTPSRCGRTSCTCRCAATAMAARSRRRPT